MNAFQYERFVELSNSDLVDYVHPIINNLALVIPQSVLQQMVSDLHRFDEGHLIFALELGSYHLPELFAPHVPQYLTHELGSVRCAASRFLERLPDALVTQELLDSARDALSSYPVTYSPGMDFFRDVLEKLESRLHVKTSGKSPEALGVSS